MITKGSGSGTRAGTEVMRAAAGWRRAARESQTGVKVLVYYVTCTSVHVTEKWIRDSNIEF